MKKVTLIVALAIISLATASAQYQTTEYITPEQIAETIDVVDTSVPTWFDVVLEIIVIFYSLVLIVLTFKLFFMCDNVKELTKNVKKLADYISSTNRQEQ